MRSKVFESYVPVVLKEAALISGRNVPEYDEVLAKVTRREKFSKFTSEVQNE